jgi:hypothetical protein
MLCSCCLYFGAAAHLAEGCNWFMSLLPLRVLHVTRKASVVCCGVYVVHWMVDPAESPTYCTDRMFGEPRACGRLVFFMAQFCTRRLL